MKWWGCFKTLLRKNRICDKICRKKLLCNFKWMKPFIHLSNNNNNIIISRRIINSCKGCWCSSNNSSNNSSSNSNNNTMWSTDLTRGFELTGDEKIFLSNKLSIKLEKFCLKNTNRKSLDPCVESFEPPKGTSRDPNGIRTGGLLILQDVCFDRCRGWREGY